MNAKLKMGIVGGGGIGGVHQMAARLDGKIELVAGQTIPEDCDFPNVEDGVAGMAFVETAVESATNGGAWTKMKSV
jgi:hypothetical protein